MNAPRTTTYAVRVEFGDCDPAAIVWFPNFFRWIDAASRDFFIQCGVPRWEDTARTLGLIGTPLVDTQARFVKTASYGDTLHFLVSVKEWRGKSFVQSYRCERRNADGSVDLIMECDEVRVFAGRREDGQPGIRALPVPESIRALCS